RRHTRWPRDWSSDVCSSDLTFAAAKVASSVYPKLALPSGLSGKDVTHDEAIAKAYDDDPLVFKSATARWFTETRLAQAHVLDNRSEERRVGKEGRARRGGGW